MAAAIVVCAGVGLALVLLWFLQRSMIYFPFGSVPDPVAVGLSDVEPVTIATSDGETLRGWWVPAMPLGGTDAAPALGTIIVFNGNAGNRGYRAELALRLRARGLNVLLFDYRGYGGSTGRPSEGGLAEDARAIRTYTLSRPGVDSSRVVYFGESLGAAVAIELAAGAPPAALVLRSPFTSLGDVGQLHYPFLPVKRLLRDRFPSLERMPRIACPVVVVAGSNDSIIPIAQSRAIFDAARGPKSWTVIEGADHNDAALVHGSAVIDAALDMVSRTDKGG